MVRASVFLALGACLGGGGALITNVHEALDALDAPALTCTQQQEAFSTNRCCQIFPNITADHTTQPVFSVGVQDRLAVVAVEYLAMQEFYASTYPRIHSMDTAGSRADMCNAIPVNDREDVPPSTLLAHSLLPSDVVDSLAVRVPGSFFCTAEPSQGMHLFDYCDARYAVCADAVAGVSLGDALFHHARFGPLAMYDVCLHQSGRACHVPSGAPIVLDVDDDLLQDQFAGVGAQTLGTILQYPASVLFHLRHLNIFTWPTALTVAALEAFGTLPYLSVISNDGAPKNITGEFSLSFPAAERDRTFMSEQMQVLDLAGENISGTVPLHLFQATTRYIDLSDNKLAGDFPVNASLRSPRLLHLDLGAQRESGGFTGTVDARVAAWSQLQYLDLHGSPGLQINTDWFSSAANDMPHLTYVDMRDTDLRIAPNTSVSLPLAWCTGTCSLLSSAQTHLLSAWQAQNSEFVCPEGLGGTCCDVPCTAPTNP